VTVNPALQGFVGALMMGFFCMAFGFLVDADVAGDAQAFQVVETECKPFELKHRRSRFAWHDMMDVYSC